MSKLTEVVANNKKTFGVIGGIAALALTAYVIYKRVTSSEEEFEPADDE